MTDALQTSAPAHVPADRIFDFDAFTDPSLAKDAHAAWAKVLREKPDVFYTPRNGGHWVVTRYELMKEVMLNTDNFSSIQTQVPLLDEPNIMIPLHLDPPNNTPYRAMIMKHFTRAALESRVGRIRAWTMKLIDGVAGKQECEFTGAIAAPFPITVFMEMMGLPLTRFDEFRDLALAFVNQLNDVEATLRNIAAIQKAIEEVIASKRAQPGDDIASALLQEHVDGRPVTPQEVEAMFFLLFIAGLDTVANAAAFLFLQLARSPAAQQRLAAHPDEIDNYVDEAFRQFGVAHTVRTPKRDVTLSGVAIRAGEPVFVPLPAAGLDAHANPDPERFDPGRSSRHHMIFGAGAHLCVGQFLARLELRLLIEEWLSRIPSFGLAPGYVPHYRGGMIMSLTSLRLALY